MDSYEIINYIASSPKVTPLKVFLSGDLEKIDFTGFEFTGGKDFGLMICEYNAFDEFYKKNRDFIKSFRVEADRRNSAIPMASLTKYNARIEPGAIIRDMVEIGNNCVIMMGAVINIGAVIGERTMIDMNTVIGGRAVIGSDCHIGAGAVIAGVIEPPNANPVVIGNNVVIGANAVVLEGIKVGNGAVIAAGSVVISDVEDNSVVAGIPAKVVKKVDEKTRSKTILIDALRKL
ncbi:MAG: 2,3,4,5-tetrahydropyridine-2,6-dicarboxylate N-acetyltransferase [Acidobacteriota bacterium]